MDAASASNVIRPNWSALFRARIEAELANLEQQQAEERPATKDYLPDLGSCVASSATEATAGPDGATERSAEPTESAASRRSGWRSIDTITQAVKDAAGMVIQNERGSS
jgi:hypothetical protein